jgi:hypothetical protein
MNDTLKRLLISKYGDNIKIVEKSGVFYIQIPIDNKFVYAEVNEEDIPEVEVEERIFLPLSAIIDNKIESMN